MKKVLILIPSLRGGGAEKVVVNLVNNFQSEEYELTLMTLFDGGVNKKFVNDNVKYKTVFPLYIRGLWRVLNLLSSKELHKLFIKREYDIEVAFLEGIATKIISGAPKHVKKIAWIHCEIYGKEEYFMEVYKDIDEFQETYSKYDRIIGVSEEVISSFEGYLPANVKKEVVNNTLDIPFIIRQSEEDMEDFNLDTSKLNFVSVGRLVEQKGYERLIKIFIDLLKKYQNIRLYILGEGKMYGELNELIPSEYKSDIVLLGYKTNPYKYIKRMDCFICSSLQEGFSTAVSEAIVCGVPFISTACSGSKVLACKGAGIRCENNNLALKEAIELFITDKEKRNKLYDGIEPTRDLLSMNKSLTRFEELLNGVYSE